MQSIDTTKDTDAPEFLKTQKIWLVWRYEDNGGKKLDKIPYYVDGTKRRGTQGSPEDTNALSDFDTALAFALTHNFEGTGIAMSASKGFSVADFDECIDSDGTINNAVLQCTQGSYTEYSPSGKGLHLFLEGDFGNEKRIAKNGNWGIELFNTRGFLTFTGKLIPSSTPSLGKSNSYLNSVINDRFKRKEYTLSAMSSTRDKISLDELKMHLIHIDPDVDYDQWMRAGMAIHYESGGSRQGFELWDDWSANGHKYSTKERNLAMWMSFKSDHPKPVRGKTLSYLNNLAPMPAIAPIIDDNTEITVPHFTSVSFKQLVTRKNSSQWLINDFLPKAGLGVIYGASRSGKSFVALDICASLARGADWNGLRCHKRNNKILYIVAEGVGGFPKRLAAYCKKENLTDPDIDIHFIMDTPLNLNKNGNADKLIADAKFYKDIDVIVVDTFAQVTPGMNESDSADMGIALAYCKRIHEAYGAMVLLIHHSGKDASRGARGHSSMLAAADVMFEVTRKGDARAISIAKQKDGEDEKAFGFRLVTVPVGVTELSERDIEENKTEGDLITSCYVEYCDILPSSDGNNLKVGAIQQLVLDALTEANGAWKTQKEIIETCIAQIQLKDGVRDNRKTNVQRAIKDGMNRLWEENENHQIRVRN